MSGFAAITDAMAAMIAQGEAPGAQTLIVRDGTMVHADYLGTTGPGTTAPRPNTLYRLGSLTKAVTSVAALMLIEAGRFALDAPVDRWLPELASPRVLRHPNAQLDDCEPSPRAITLLDLLTHRAGFASTLPLGPVGRAAAGLSAGISRRADLSADAWMAKLGSVPLIHPPGDRVLTSFASDALGIMIERETGVTLDRYFADRIFAPLGMTETHFWLKPGDLPRLAPALTVNFMTGRAEPVDPASDGDRTARPAFASGGGGLIGTAADMAAFATMLARGGIGAAGRMLDAELVRLMTSDLMTPEQRAMPFFGYPYWRDRGFGMGVFVLDANRSQGERQFGWRGAFGTYWVSDPQTQRTALLMVQTAWPAVVPPMLSVFEREATRLIRAA